MLEAWIDLARVLGAAILFYWAVPYFSRHIASETPARWEDDLLPSILRAVILFQVAGITLGAWRLGYSGMVLVVVAAWVAAEVTFSTRRRNALRAEWWRAQAVRVAVWMEKGSWRGAAGSVREQMAGSLSAPLALALTALSVVGLLVQIGFPLVSQRFLEFGTYARAMSLYQLTSGGRGWYPDGSVAFLIPIAHFSGVDAAAVIRWTGPIFSAAVLVALAYAGWVWTRSLAAACFAPLVLECYQRWIAVRSYGEAGPAEIAAFFWLAAAGVLRTSKVYALGAALVALSVRVTPPIVLAPAVLALGVGAGLAWVGRQYGLTLSPRRLAPVIGVCGALLHAGAGKPPGDGPIQYEAGARVAARIAAERPRNRYLVVSPTQESVAIYGRGWHEELANFVRRFHPSMPISERFRFPYPIPEMYVFVEKAPLPQAAVAPSAAYDANSYFYYTRTGRTSLQFQAGQIMAAYAATHAGCSVYYEDDKLMVYRVLLERPGGR